MKIQQIFSTYDLFATLKNKFCIHDVYPLRQNFRNKTPKPQNPKDKHFLLELANYKRRRNELASTIIIECGKVIIHAG